jgi:alpha-L-fucosidase 2
LTILISRIVASVSALCILGGGAALADAPTPISDVAALMPAHGTVSIVPAKRWDDGLAAGNGIMGALLYGDPTHDTLLVDDCKLWLPAGSREVVPDVGKFLPEMRKIIGEKGYQAGQNFFIDKAKESGWGGHLVWTDAFHPGFFLSIDQPQEGAITQYARVENFSSGEVRAQWHTDQGEFSRRMFVSKPDNTIVTTTIGPAGKVSLKLVMQKLENDLIESTVTHEQGWIAAHNVYVKGKGGYECAVRVINDGGTQTTDGKSVSVDGANSVTLLIRILPWRTPLPGSEAWPNDPANPDFAGDHHVAKRDTVQIAGSAFDPQWADELKTDLQSMSGDYESLLKAHSAAWGELFNRVSIDLGGSIAERAMPSETLLDVAQKEKRLPPAMLERMYDAGRYVFMCSAGPKTPPNLFGIWTGTWHPAWSGDYTTDTNLQLDTELAYSANLADCMAGYFDLWDGYLPDFQRNAKSLYGCRGIATGSRASNNGLSLHWDNGWPGNQWMPGAAWIAHWYYDYYRYTGDKQFLRDRAIPFMKQCALFWEDFLNGTEDANGKYLFRPSFSAENGYGDDSSQDIEITHELLTNLIAGCQILGVEQDGVERWKQMLAKMPPLLINKEGQLKEWSNPTQGEKNNHRHLMHLYGAFESQQFSEEEDPTLFAAARVALMNRVKASTEDATHGFMHTGLAAAGLGMGDLAYQRIELLGIHRSIYPSFVDGHFGGPRVLCDDGNGSTPEIIDRMLVQSKIGRLALLPALPSQLPHGSISGICARGAVAIEHLAWDLPAGTLSATLMSPGDQKIDLVMPPGTTVQRLAVDNVVREVTDQGVRKQGCTVTLSAGKPVEIEAAFHPMENPHF